MERRWWVTATGERAEMWERVFGSATVPVLDPRPRLAILRGRGLARVYRLDVSWLSPEARDRVVESVVADFGLARSEVEAALRGLDEADGDHGVPLPAEGLVLSELVPAVEVREWPVVEVRELLMECPGCGGPMSAAVGAFTGKPGGFLSTVAVCGCVLSVPARVEIERAVLDRGEVLG